MMLSVSSICSISAKLINDEEAVDGMKISTDKQSTQRKPAPVSFCPAKILHDLNSDQTQAAAVRR
jgi:hypothetical protein